MANSDSIALTLTLAEVAAGTDQQWFVTVPHPGKFRLDAVYFASDTARTAHASNYTTMSVEIGGTAVCSHALDTATTDDLTAGEVVAFTLTGTGTQLEVSQGETLEFIKADTGTGLALDGSVSFLLTEIRD